MSHRFINPPEYLKEYVRCFWTYDFDGTNPNDNIVRIIVDESSGLVFHHYNGHSAFLDDYNQKVYTGLVYGKQMKPSRAMAVNPLSATGVTFTSQGLNLLFRMDAHELTDVNLSVEDFGYKEICEQIMESAGHQERIHLLCKFIYQKIDNKRKADSLIQHCCQKIIHCKGNVSIRALSDYYNISPRQLERRFKQSVGLSPKFFAKVSKFKHALAAISLGQPLDFVDLVYKLNYPDQSRFIQNVKQFTGMTPTILLKENKQILLLSETNALQ
jgi:methylphosphotriester-DNA--protein-cysteine methyltransferase